MLKVYRCAYPNHQIVVTPSISSKGLDPGRKGEYIQFMNGTFKTDNEKYQNILESNILFGTKLFLDKVEKVETLEPGTEEQISEETQSEQKRGRGNPNFGKKN